MKPINFELIDRVFQPYKVQDGVLVRTESIDESIKTKQLLQSALKDQQSFKQEHCSGFHYCVSCEDAYPCDVDGGCGKFLPIVCGMCKGIINESQKNLENVASLQQQNARLKKTIDDVIMSLNAKIVACNERISENNKSDTDAGRNLVSKYRFGLDEFTELHSLLQKE